MYEHCDDHANAMPHSDIASCLNIFVFRTSWNLINLSSVTLLIRSFVVSKPSKMSCLNSRESSAWSTWCLITRKLRRPAWSTDGPDWYDSFMVSLGLNRKVKKLHRTFEYRQSDWSDQINGVWMLFYSTWLAFESLCGLVRASAQSLIDERG